MISLNTIHTHTQYAHTYIPTYPGQIHYKTSYIAFKTRHVASALYVYTSTFLVNVFLHSELVLFEHVRDEPFDGNVADGFLEEESLDESGGHVSECGRDQQQLGQPGGLRRVGGRAVPGQCQLRLVLQHADGGRLLQLPQRRAAPRKLCTHTHTHRQMVNADVRYDD